ncbi:MAG: hypothetical protein ABI614_26170 [Planctomycetota bacterium]
MFDQHDEEESNDKLTVQPQWVEVNASGVRIENSRQFGIEIRKRCLSKPTDHQPILLDRLQLRLPKINQTEM